VNVRASATTTVLRCAVYTRKSSEEGLEQSFNSLHAQREACEAYIKSQSHEGWVCLPEAYDDGGFSGGSMERPGLQRLLSDIQKRRVDVVVVYKVDRLTRALTDFAKIVDIFDGAAVSFVSITQAFNTTTSMGRLTLNVLLSFAQFEREVTGERIRDKIAASKAKGMWMGGVLPLGYDRKDRTLTINAAEAEIVRMIFARYLKLGSVRDLQEELDRRGVRSKSWVTRDGGDRGGAAFSRGALYHLLQSRLYRGEIQHGELFYPGQHPAILEGKIFDAVQRKLAKNRTERRRSPSRSASALLTGRIFDADGQPMSPSFSYGQGGKLYRYYIAIALQRGGRPSSGDGAIRRVPADSLEHFVIEQLCRFAEVARLDDTRVRALVRRVDLRENTTRIVLDADALFGDDHPELAFEDLQTRLGVGERAVREPDDATAVRILIPARMQFRGGRTFLEHNGMAGVSKPRINPGLVAGLKSAHLELRALNASPLSSPADLRAAIAPETHHRRQVSKLAFLAPDLQRAILEGRQPPGFKLRSILKADLPLSWDDQRAWLPTLR
jgi:DNA invertase Pin-like site-specific DNA recombinase